MKYVANPVEVDAFKIVKVLPAHDEHLLRAVLEDGRTVTPETHMLARILPKEGDYWVVQSDGYTYLNPKDVFERKYKAVTPKQEAPSAGTKPAAKSAS